MKILVVNVNTTESMTAAIGEAARSAASRGTEIIPLTPPIGAESCEGNLESYLAAVAVMDRVRSYAGDYDAIRDVMAQVLPGFGGFNHVVRQPHGFRIPQPARERVWLTPSGKVEFSLAELPNVVPDDPQVLVLQTMRSHDQWNTTIYSNNDRYRGIKNIREVIFVNAEDLRERGLVDGDRVDITATAKDGSQRVARGYRAVAYDLPRGSAAGYYPELNILIGWSDHSEQSDQPIAKGIQVKISPASRS